MKLKKGNGGRMGSRSWLDFLRPGVFFAIGNVVAVVGVLSVLVFYRTNPAAESVLATALAVLCVVLVVTSVASAACWLMSCRHERVLRNIENNLSGLSDEAEAASKVKELVLFPVGQSHSNAAKGWNNLLGLLDQLQNELEIGRAEGNMEQVLGSYESQRHRELFDALPVGVILADASGEILMANRSCEGMLARPLSQFFGCSIADIFDDVASQEALQGFLNRWETASECNFEVTVQSGGDDGVRGSPEEPNEPDKASAPVETARSSQTETTHLRVSCLRIHETRENSDVILTIRDVTQQKISDSARNDFIAHVSHELRSPLANIRAYAETLLSDMVLDDSTQKEAYNVINEETNRLTRMVNEVLDLTRMESGTVSLDKGEVVMDRLIHQGVSDLTAFAASKKITLQTNFHPKIPNLYADRDKLTIVVNNILSNAIKYTPEGGTVFVETDVDEHLVYIKITDTGYGIGAEDIDKIFEKFYRVEREETVGITGSGLGLATSKEIMTLHGGSIDVSSEINKGTEVTIKLPLTVTGPVLGPAVEPHAR
ncbi:MAG: PAS domain-containing protein [Planctomycetes bacterium]|nr:PAS domain-containing protein [Planctomycetota bacterium]